MSNIYEKIVNEENSQKRNTIWYSLGSICSSASSMIILLVVTRILGAESSGIFSLAWSAAQLMLTIGWFSTRQYQVSDVQECFKFYDYYYAKVISSILMMICAIVYVRIYGYSQEQSIATLLLCVLMICEVFADFYGGFWQHKGKLHIAGKSYVLRNGAYVLAFIIILCVVKSIWAAIAGAIIVAATCILVFDVTIKKKFYNNDIKRIQIKRSLLIFKECFPLFIGSFITSFVMNIPKNSINKYLSNDIQAVYNILFMPSSVINMFTLFLCVPYYDKLALLWYEQKYAEFKKLIQKMIIIVCGITAVILIGGGTVGIPILTWLYGVNLKPYRVPFLILLAGGGITGIISILTYTITVMRKQQIIAILYGCVAVIAQVITGIMVKRYEITGATVTYTGAMLLLGIIFGALVWKWIRKSLKQRI